MEPSRAQPSGSQAVVSRCLGSHSAVCLAIAAGVCWNSKVFFYMKIDIFLISQENPPKRSFLVRKYEGLGRQEIFSFSKIVFGRVGWHMLSISSQLLVLQVGCWQASKSAPQLFGKCVEPHQGSL